MDEQKQLMNDTLEQTIEYLPRLIKGIDELINKFQTGSDEQVMVLFGSVLDGLEWVNDAINLTMPFWSGSTSIDPHALGEPLEAMAEALKNRDYTLICDVLAYEIKPTLMQWLNNIKICLRG